ncbi:putative lipase YOR059C isoform X1 [Ananas comosus]|uniref:Lipase YOR059C isoform X1 n=1 Tax=Ananas comosus TaxID=4615 RepID=A0A6P5EPR6_ANACO|nr:putative lipase YOR059C isoform X1 [Ananas comosus]
MAQGEKKRRGWEGVTYRAYLRRPSCFKVVDGSPVSGGGGGGGGGEGERRIPTPPHLVVMVNGIVGSAADWKFAAKKFVKKYPEDVIVHCSECNSATLTLDGVDMMGERLAEEVISVVSKRPWLQKISFVAHSLGGLIARYTIALLYEKGISKESSEDNGELNTNISQTQSVNQNLKGNIAGLEPMNFITFATPHLGTRSHKQIPLLGGINTLEKMAFRLSWIARKSGKHLFLKDGKDGKPPLLLQMVTDFGDLRFMSALQSFKRHVAYSNVCGDFVVGRKTSSIRRQNELPKRQNFIKDGKYPHIVYVEKPKPATNQPDDFSDAMIYQARTTAEMEEAMIRGLNRVPWERVDVSFKKSKQRIFAHSTIQVKTYFLHSDGADVIFHMIDHFLL